MALPIDQWGPKCARCGDEEYRIDGYCSIYCRDMAEVEARVKELELLPLSKVVDTIRQLCDSFSTQKAAAKHLGISGQYLTDVLKGRREPGPKILQKLGFEKVIGYR